MIIRWCSLTEYLRERASLRGNLSTGRQTG